MFFNLSKIMNNHFFTLCDHSYFNLPDYIGKRIYWIDSKLHKIGTANMDGSDKRHVLVDSSEIRRPFSISVFEDSLYWTDWHTNSIRSIHKVTGRNPKTLSLGSYSVMDIKVYHELRQIRGKRKS